jgi:hypothetical protein
VIIRWKIRVERRVANLNVGNQGSWFPSDFGHKVLAAEVFEILKSNFTVTVSVEDFQVALDVCAGGREDSVEGFVGVYYHGHHLNAVNHPVSVSVVSIHDPAGHSLSSFSVSQSRVDQHSRS